jgi:hypothetical protein
MISNKIKKKLMLILLPFVFVGCETPISVTIPHKESTKIIEGWIENNKSAVVIVTNSIAYFSKVDTAALLASIDRNAIVRVSDDMGNTEQLQRGFSLEHVFGMLGGAHVGRTIKGIPGHTYTLYVESEGKVYTATTTIPVNTVLVDSFSLIQRADDTTATLRIFLTDRAETYDCYRFFLKIAGLDLIYSQIYTGTFDDLTFNGLSGSYEMLRSPMSNLPIMGRTEEERENYYRSTFRKGEVIHIRSTLTDRATQEYWFPLQLDISMGMSPFITPGVYTGNIEGEDVSGIWSGYHARYDTVVFK